MTIADTDKDTAAQNGKTHKKKKKKEKKKHKERHGNATLVVKWEPGESDAVMTSPGRRFVT